MRCDSFPSPEPRSSFFFFASPDGRCGSGSCETVGRAGSGRGGRRRHQRGVRGRPPPQATEELHPTISARPHPSTRPGPLPLTPAAKSDLQNCPVRWQTRASRGRLVDGDQSEIMKDPKHAKVYRCVWTAAAGRGADGGPAGAENNHGSNRKA